MPVMALFTALPTWVKVGAGMGLLMGVMWVNNWWNTRDLKRDLAKQEQLLKTTQEAAAQAAADAKQQIEREATNRKEQQAAINRQNARISSIAASAKQAETAAALTTLRLIKEGQEAAEALRQPSTTVPVGYEGMNEWLQKRLRS